MLLVSSPFFSPYRSHIAELAIQQRLPTMFIFKAYAEAGGLNLLRHKPSGHFS
jgi:hypothetical protein